MSATFIGGLIGLGVGFSGFLALRMIADRIERERGAEGRPQATILRMVGIVDFVAMTLFGAYIGSTVFGG